MSQVNLVFQVRGYFVGTQADLEALTDLEQGFVGYATDRGAGEHFGTYNGSAWEWTTAGAGGDPVEDQIFEASPLPSNPAHTDLLGVVRSGALYQLDLDTFSQDYLAQRFLQKITNLSDLASPSSARTNLGLGDSATKNVGTGADNVAAGNRGVTNGDSHDHNGGDGAQIAYSSLSGLPTLPTDGTWTPTLTNTTNIDSSVAHLCHWMRVGSHVVVGGVVEIDATALGSVVLKMSLPVSSDFDATEDANGTISAPGSNSVVGSIIPDTTANTLDFRLDARVTTNVFYRFTAIYIIK